MNESELFEKKGFVYVKNFIDEQTTIILEQYFRNKIKRGEWVKQVKDEVSKYAYYADPLTEVLLLSCQKFVENTIQKEIIPTYSYCRLYQVDDDLKKHVDRKSCEITVTVNVAHMDERSPIFMQYKDNTEQKFFLNRGDAIIYKGCEVDHWRLPFEEKQSNLQFMLHYVDKYGSNIEFAKDKRNDYGYNSIW